MTILNVVSFFCPTNINVSVLMKHVRAKLYARSLKAVEGHAWHISYLMLVVVVHTHHIIPTISLSPHNDQIHIAIVAAASRCRWVLIVGSFLKSTFIRIDLVRFRSFL